MFRIGFLYVLLIEGVQGLYVSRARVSGIQASGLFRAFEICAVLCLGLQSQASESRTCLRSRVLLVSLGAPVLSLGRAVVVEVFGDGLG